MRSLRRCAGQRNEDDDEGSQKGHRGTLLVNEAVGELPPISGLNSRWPPCCPNGLEDWLCKLIS